jgi:hypothetical protein
MPHAAMAMGTLADTAEARWAARRMVALAAWRALVRAASRVAAWNTRRRRVGQPAAASSLS